MPDYYSILGVSREATQEDIKRAYRKLARESHPDANPGDPHAEDRFKQVSQAYKVLSDPEARRRFDTFGDAGAAGAPFGGVGDLHDIMDAFFGGSPFGRTRARRTSAVSGQDIGVAVTITLEQAVFGTTAPVEVATVGVCERCSGDGCEPGTFRDRCSRCGGQGEIRASRQTILGTVMTSRPCSVCGGAGEAPTAPCTACSGQGRTRATRPIDIEIPPGVDDGTTVRLRGHGEAGVRGGRDGDLYVQIAVTPHDIFEREGDDLVCDLAVPLTQAILGAELPVTTLDGEETLRIPPGMQHGSILRIRGKGVPRIRGSGRGDLLVHLSVEIPQKLSDEERELIERLAAVRGEEVGGQSGLFRRLRDSLRGN